MGWVFVFLFVCLFLCLFHMCVMCVGEEEEGKGVLVFVL